MENLGTNDTPFSQPFRSQLENFQSESSRPARGNVGKNERLMSAVSALPILALGARSLSRKKYFAGLTSLLTGSAMLWRAASGNCALYKALGINRNHDQDNPNVSVKGDQGVKVEHILTIQKPAHELYQFWRRLENLPLIMRHLKSVTTQDNTHSHWVAKAPLGQEIAWDAEIINDTPDGLIAWRSLEGSQVDSAGSVRFKDVGSGATEIKVALKYDPPGGKLGVAVAKLFRQDASSEISEDLQKFKEAMEGATPLASASIH